MPYCSVPSHSVISLTLHFRLMSFFLSPFSLFYFLLLRLIYSFPVAEADRQTTSRIKIVFESSTDFFGRITVYKLDILGQDA